MTVPPDQRSEAELIERAIVGDDRAFEELTRRHHRPVRAFCRRIATRTGDGDDIAQSAFLTAWRRRSTYAGGAFRSWVCAIAWRIFLKRPQMDTVAEVADEGTLASDAERLDLMNALASLRPEERAAVALCVGEGLSHAEAARVLDAPIGTVKSWTLRGRARLQTMLSDYAPEYRGGASR